MAESGAGAAGWRRRDAQAAIGAGGRGLRSGRDRPRHADAGAGASDGAAAESATTALPGLPAMRLSAHSASSRKAGSLAAASSALRADCAFGPILPRAPAAKSKRVLVVGAGPGGLETARLCARRGHRVTVYERQAHLGGSLAMAAAVHPENQPFLDFLRGEIRRLGIEVKLGQGLDADAVVQLAPDAVVLATGGRVSAPKIPGDDQRHVVSGTFTQHELAVPRHLGGLVRGRHQRLGAIVPTQRDHRTPRSDRRGHRGDEGRQCRRGAAPARPAVQARYVELVKPSRLEMPDLERLMEPDQPRQPPGQAGGARSQ